MVLAIQGLVAGLVVLHPDTFELINSWLEYHDLPASSALVTHGGNWPTLTGVSLSRANDLLGMP